VAAVSRRRAASGEAHGRHEHETGEDDSRLIGDDIGWRAARECNVASGNVAERKPSWPCQDTKEPRIARLTEHAAEIRKELQVPRQNDVFRCAVEAGYLAALADGEVDDAERHTIARAAEILSVAR